MSGTAVASATENRKQAAAPEAAAIVRPSLGKSKLGIVLGVLGFYALVVTILLFAAGGGEHRVPAEGTPGAGPPQIEDVGGPVEPFGTTVPVPSVQQGFLDETGNVAHRAEITVTVEVRRRAGQASSDEMDVQRVREAVPWIQDEVQHLLNDYKFNDLFDASRQVDIKERIRGSVNQRLGGIVSAVYLNILAEW